MRQGWDDLAISGRLITAKGVKPKGLNQCWRDNFYLYGVVEPESGYSFTCEFSHLDADCFQRFLDLLAVELGDDVAVMQMEQGSFHRSLSVDYPENIIPIFQPSHCQATFWGEASPKSSRLNLIPLSGFGSFLKATLSGKIIPLLLN